MVGERVFPARATQTTVKHSILEDYLRAWGGIIVNSNRGRDISLRYVDTCCGSGLYERDPDEPRDPQQPYDTGSAIIGLQELGKIEAYARGRARSTRTAALLLNESAAELETLEKAIADIIPARPKYETRNGLFGALAPDVVQFCERSFSFVFIDPYGPAAVPFSAVAPVVRGRFTDALIHFPYYSVQKWTGWLDRPGEQELRLARADAMMNGREWRELAREARAGGQDLAPILLQHYESQLAGLGVLTSSIPLYFPDRARVFYHLIFTTHKASGLDAAKTEFQKATQYQAYLREKERERKTGQSVLFSVRDEVLEDPVEVEQLASEIRRRFSQGAYPFDEVAAHGMSKPHVLAKHVTKALQLLRKEGTASFAKASWKNMIEFR